MRAQQRQRRHVSVDARTKRRIDRGRLGPGAATVPFRSSGYMVIHNVLGASELAELNRLIDGQRLPNPRESIRFGSAAGVHGPDHGFLNWGEPFCRLLDHEAIMPVLRFRLGDCFRLDRLYGIRMHKGQTMGAMHADYGASARNSFTKPGERFHFASNGIYEGFTVAAWNLADAGPTSGGFGASRQSQESLQAATPDPRGPGKSLLRGHSGGNRGLGRPVLRGHHARNSPVDGRPRAPDSALQVLRLPDGLVRRRVFRHPMSRSPLGSKRSSSSRRIPTRSFLHSSATDPARSIRTSIRRPLPWPSLL